jgi:macrolide transport system ATP-binding/permease protein
VKDNPAMRFLARLKQPFSSPYFSLIRFIGVLVPQRLRADWQREWQAELRWREWQLVEWERLNWQSRLRLSWLSLGAFSDALWLQTFRWEDEMFQDLRYGVRMLLKRPGFTLVAVLSLALGIGANTAIFSVINTLLLHPLPIAEPGRLVAINNQGENRMFSNFSYPNYKDLRAGNEVCDDLIAYRILPLSLSYDGVNERLWGYEVSGNYFAMLGIQPALGRLLSEEDDQTPGAHPVVVISHKFWQRGFAGEPGVIGRDIIVNGRHYTIIGVAPQGFLGTEIVSASELWFPIAMQAQLEVGSDWLTKRGSEVLFVQGRLRPGVSSAQAQAGLNVVAAQLEREYPDENSGKHISLSPPGLFGNTMRGTTLGFVGLLMAVVGLVLLLACVNLANLLLARATERRQEIAVRLAIGASRLRLIRQLLTESLLLAAGGGALGLLPAIWLVNLVAAIKLPANVPVALAVHIDYRVYLFTFLLSLATGVLFGLVPAWQATRTDLLSALKDEGAFGGQWRPTRRNWLKSGLIVLQVALSLILLLGGGLMVRALQQANTLKLGFEPQGAAEVSFDLRLQGYESAARKEFQKQLLERLRNLPEVQAVGLTDLPPVDLHFSRTSVYLEGQLPERNARVPSAMYNLASPGYFQAIGTRLIEGREFTAQDNDQAAQVAIINETFARTFFPGENPLGKQFRMGRSEAARVQIVGVVEDGKYAGLTEEPKPYVSRPMWQSQFGSTSVIVRGANLPGLMAAVRGEIQQLDPHIPVAASTLVEKLSMPLLPARITASILGGFGLLALVLAAIGIYGVMSYAIAQRTHEIGIRMALGAQKADVLKLVLGQGVVLTLIGVGLGLAAALALTRLMKSLLFGVSATDPLTFIGIAGLLTFVTLLACYLPARRATRVDPLIALRHS